jgi:hypothetical protein
VGPYIRHLLVIFMIHISVLLSHKKDAIPHLYLHYVYGSCFASGVGSGDERFSFSFFFTELG